MTDYRLMFAKEGKAVYISHLDLLRTMQRIFARAGLRVKHTEGFNPRPHMVFALPLSVGTSSCCEIVDFSLLNDGLTPDTITELLKPQCPAGITPIKTWKPDTKLNKIAWLKAEADIKYSHISEEEMSFIKSLFEKDELLIEKKTHKGLNTINILPRIKEIDFALVDDSHIKMTCTVEAQDPGLNPSLIIKAISAALPQLCMEAVHIKRLAMLTEDGSLFR